MQVYISPSFLPPPLQPLHPAWSAPHSPVQELSPGPASSLSPPPTPSCRPALTPNGLEQATAPEPSARFQSFRSVPASPGLCTPLPPALPLPSPHTSARPVVCAPRPTRGATKLDVIQLHFTGLVQLQTNEKRKEKTQAEGTFIFKTKQRGNGGEESIFCCGLGFCFVLFFSFISCDPEFKKRKKKVK